MEQEYLWQELSSIYSVLHDYLLFFFSVTIRKWLHAALAEWFLKDHQSITVCLCCVFTLLEPRGLHLFISMILTCFGGLRLHFPSWLICFCSSFKLISVCEWLIKVKLRGLWMVFRADALFFLFFCSGFIYFLYVHLEQMHYSGPKSIATLKSQLKKGGVIALDTKYQIKLCLKSL